MKINVFYVDDEPFLCENFEETFKSSEIQITTFTDPKTMLEYAKKTPPDAVFLDYRLPSTDGDKVAQALNAKIPIFLITGDLSITTIYKFDRIITKPYENSEIEEALTIVMAKHRALLKT